MEWTENHDVVLCREILLTDPFQSKQRTVQRGQLWQSIADHLNDAVELKFKVSKRGVRERYSLLAEKFKKNTRNEERASGIDTEMTELDILVEEIIAKEEHSEETHQNSTAENKKKADQSKADGTDMRLKAMETLKESNKRKGEDSEKQKHKRTRGSDAVEYLREKMEIETHLREKELELKRKDQEKEVQKQVLADKQHSDFITLMERQQQQMQQMQLNFMQGQQQQSKLLISLMESVVKKV